MRVALLTGGGDAPGLNGIIEAVTRGLILKGHEVIGVRDGFAGIFESNTIPLTLERVAGTHALAGTILGTSNRCGIEGREEEFLTKYRALNVDGLIAAGGDGTFRGLSAFKDEIPLLGVPKTIDNDLSGTDITFGYDTACSVVSSAIDNLRQTADAHDRVIVIEVMGRTAGWIALGGGMAGYADAILIPERNYSLKKLETHISELKNRGQRGVIIVVSEGTKIDNTEFISFNVEGSPQSERYGGVSEFIARTLDDNNPYEARNVVLGHLQRGLPPTTTDRFLTLAMGSLAASLVHENQWQKACVYLNGKVVPAPLETVMGDARLVDSNHRWVKMAQSVGMFI